MSQSANPAANPARLGRFAVYLFVFSPFIGAGILWEAAVQSFLLGRMGWNAFYEMEIK